MSSTEAAYSVTFKTPKGNLVTVRGDSSLDWMANLNSAAESGALGLISQIEASLAGQGNPPAGQAQPAPAQAPPSNVVPMPAQAQQPQGSLNPACPTCGGSTHEKTGNGSRGPWRGFFCDSAPKDGPKHAVVWA